jgi:hypothetical protein
MSWLTWYIAVWQGESHLWNRVALVVDIHLILKSSQALKDNKSSKENTRSTNYFGGGAAVGAAVEKVAAGRIKTFKLRWKDCMHL